MGSEDNTNKLLDYVLKTPGIKVDRRSFLIKAFPQENAEHLITDGPIKSLGQDVVDKEATKIIQQETLKSSSMSFAAGLPGGFTMAATIPADTVQFYVVALRLAQKLGYLYDKEDLWNDMDATESKETLLLYLGVMFGVSGTGAMLRVVSAQVSKQALKRIPQKALTKTVYYPILKRIGRVVGVQLTKGSFAKGVSKIIPLIGGVVSGGMTYATMIPMGNKLKNELSKSIDYDEDTFRDDLADLNIIDGDYEEINDDKSQQSNNPPSGVADEIMKFKNLLDIGAITEKEYSEYKDKILHKAGV